MAMPVPAASVFLQPGHPALGGEEAIELKITLITKKALWVGSTKEHHLSSLVLLLLPPSVPAESISIYKDWGSQPNEGLDVDLKQL